ncbi:MAG: DUF2309 domain-containing protein [Lunatimonas sp.]|uniref:YbcC family protein n=1 Tax=Lunatimonas sp. TaxID=2060141 RepID=UPI00263B4D55|nr:DUF2309 domain-containing protein [Lunatimonas sp.]MCC5935743.1 DUF2309 domain-containing protein [Lunatimonas sp.]
MEDHLLTQEKEAKVASLASVLQEACKKIAPVWPLENFVAVNPYLGLTDQKFNNVAQYLGAVAGIQMTLPVSFYRTKIQEGVITRGDLQAAFKKHSTNEVDVETFIRGLGGISDAGDPMTSVATLTDVATVVSGKDWNRFSISRISTWAATYFDNGQAVWNVSNRQGGMFLSWKWESQIDKTPEVTGLKNFRAVVKAMPNQPLLAAKSALEVLGVSDEALPIYLHRLLLRVGGWSAHAARLDWDNALYGKEGGVLQEFLIILICWEACLLQCLKESELNFVWLEAKKQLSEAGLKIEISHALSEKLLLQEAFDIAMQRELITKFQATDTVAPEKAARPLAQGIFCIDVRSEVFRRNLEQVNPQIETIGFAGFFAFPINFVPIAHEQGEAQCPVLIPTGPTIMEELQDKASHEVAYRERVLRYQVKKIWKSFKSGAVTCFSFVSPMGLSFLPKLFTDSFGMTRPVPHPDRAGLKGISSKRKTVSLQVCDHHQGTTGIPLEKQVEMAKTALKAMSLTENFAQFVMIIGHGSTSVNNPHATGLDCGACGGHTGEANAKVAAAVLNGKQVREALRKQGIAIPVDTVFLACLHDTTTDEVTVFNEDAVPESMVEDYTTLTTSLSKAAKATRAERGLRMAITRNQDKAVLARSKDWSQVRPEWGLAGCHAFVVAPRNRTKHIDLGGKSFLHSYDWKKDSGFSILELIMTAPMVVTSWINLQYYGSTVDNLHFGSGNKTLHNVTSGTGVLEGYSGDLRVGLPLQSVHDGEKYQHEPVRLNVIIEAPLDAMNGILEKHSTVKNLCDNGWISLLALNEEGKVAYRYEGGLQWECV